MIGTFALALATHPSSISGRKSLPPLPLSRAPSLVSFIAGAGGGLVASIATCPLDVVKTKLQAQQVISGQHGYEGVAGEHPRTRVTRTYIRVI